jgi:cytochrome c biogenesis protein CcdA
MYNRIWHEMLQAKFSCLYASALIGLNRQWVNTFNFLSAAFSLGGILLYKEWQYAAVVACTIVSIVSIKTLHLLHPLHQRKTNSHFLAGGSGGSLKRGIPLR